MAAAAKLFRAKDPKDRAYETKLLKANKESLEVTGTHRRSGLARDHKLPKSLFKSTAYKELVDAHAKLVTQVGEPPFEVTMEDSEKDGTAASFAELRRVVLDLARQGVQLQRFKGLGEMNPEQLRETTMDPGSRTLQQVTIDDAAATAMDETFADLMGDQVAPRKEFIEKHARDVGVLDV